MILERKSQSFIKDGNYSTSSGTSEVFLRATRFGLFAFPANLVRFILVLSRVFFFREFALVTDLRNGVYHKGKGGEAVTYRVTQRRLKSFLYIQREQKQTEMIQQSVRTTLRQRQRFSSRFNLLSNTRYQSSSSNAKVLQEKEAKLQQLHKTQKELQKAKLFKQQQQKKMLAEENANRKSTGVETIKLKKGFSNVNKVPETHNLEPKDVLLDRLYQGFNPLLSPIKPALKKKQPKILVNILDDLQLDDDMFVSEEDEVIDSMLGPKLTISKYIFDKDPQVEAKLKELDAMDAEEVNGGRSSADIVAASFEERGHSGQRGRGRLRVQFKRNSKTPGPKSKSQKPSSEGEE